MSPKNGSVHRVIRVLSQLRNPEERLDPSSAVLQSGTGRTWGCSGLFEHSNGKQHTRYFGNCFANKTNQTKPSQQYNNSLDRNQNNLQCLFCFPSAVTYVSATRSEKYQNVHFSLSHTTKISENIYSEHAKRLQSGDN